MGCSVFGLDPGWVLADWTNSSTAGGSDSEVFGVRGGHVTGGRTARLG